MNSTIIIAGSGKLANSMIKGLPGYLPGHKIDTWENHDNYPENDLVIVHIGSGRQLTEIIDFCEMNGVPLIQGSTGMNIKRTDFDFTYIDAPNLNILMLKFMFMMKEHGALYKDYRISITESHQESKQTLPGTAIELAGSLGIDHSEITSIRDRNEQESVYGIEEEFLPLHAYHEIRIQEGDTTIDLRTLVKGHESYVSGLSAIIKCLGSLESRYYHVLDLIESGMI